MTEAPEPEQRPVVDLGCRVDWSWLAGREVVGAESDLQTLVLTFRDGQTLTVRAGLYGGAPFLSFVPWQAP